jgi:hypothetical protein
VTAGDWAAIAAAAVAVATLLGGYVQFVLRRTGLGQVEFDLELTEHYRGPKELIVEIACVIKNLGSNMVVVENLQLRARYRTARDDQEERDASQGRTEQEGRDRQGRDNSEVGWRGIEPELRHAIKPEVRDPDPEKRLLPGAWFYVLQPPRVWPGEGARWKIWSRLSSPLRRREEPAPEKPRTDVLRTFVQAGVTQRYRRPITLPADAQALHVWGAFYYRIEIRGLLTRFLIATVGRPPRGMDWRKVMFPHTVRRTFSLTGLNAAHPSEASMDSQ